MWQRRRIISHVPAAMARHIDLPHWAVRPQWSSAFDAEAFELASINTMSLQSVNFNRLVMSLTRCSSESLKYMMWIQPVDATSWLNRSAGVS